MAIAPYLAPPTSDSYWLVNARLPLALMDETVSYRETIPLLATPPFAEALVAAEVEVHQGQIRAIAAPGTAPVGAAMVDVGQGLIFPCFVDLHTHLDKGQTWNRRPNPDGTFQSALQAVMADAEHWDEAELYQRIEFGLRCSYVHGTKAIRTHFDAFGEMAGQTLTVLRDLQQVWASRLTVQLVCLVSLDYYLTPEGEQLADLIARNGGILGGVVYPHPDLDTQLDRVFTLASDRNLAVDLHVDESLEPSDTGLRQVAQAKLRHGFTAPVVCGHCCSLSVQSPAEIAETLQWVKAAELGIVSLPLCNLYLQDRQPQRTPRYRGITILHELKQQGIPVALASDNCRDPFHAYGDHDGLEVLTQGVRIGHLDRPIGDWARTVTWTPADLMGLPDTGRLGIGQPADMVVFKARTFNELFARPQSDRLVLRQGRAIDMPLPDYAELDTLLGVY
jgi:cytosine deaminase